MHHQDKSNRKGLVTLHSFWMNLNWVQSLWTQSLKMLTFWREVQSSLTCVNSILSRYSSHSTNFFRAMTTVDNRLWSIIWFTSLKKTITCSKFMRFQEPKKSLSAWWCTWKTLLRWLHHAISESLRWDKSWAETRKAILVDHRTEKSWPNTSSTTHSSMRIKTLWLSWFQIFWRITMMIDFKNE